MSDANFDKMLKEHFANEKVPESTKKVIENALNDIDSKNGESRRYSSHRKALDLRRISLTFIIIIIIIAFVNVIVFNERNTTTIVADSGEQIVGKTFYEKIYEGKDIALELTRGNIFSSSYEFEGYEKLYQDSDLVIEAEVIEIKESNNYFEDTDKYIQISTGIELNIKKILKNSKKNSLEERLNIYINGGTLDIKQYNKNPDIHSFSGISEDEQNDKYVSLDVTDSIKNLTEGKEYTFYLIYSEVYNEYFLKSNEYSIVQK